MPEYLLW